VLRKEPDFVIQQTPPKQRRVFQHKKKPTQKPWQKQCFLTRQQWKQGETLEEAQQKAKCEPEQAKLDEEK
jgi:hypothetical protein